MVATGRFCGRDEQDVKRGALNTMRGGDFSERQTFRRKLRVRQRARDWRGLVRSATEHGTKRPPESPTAGGWVKLLPYLTHCRCRRGTRPNEKK